MYLPIRTSCHFLFGSASEHFAASHAFQTCIGLVICAILGLAAPGLTWNSILGTLCVGALKAIVPILVFVLVSSSLANARGGAGSAAKFRRVIFLHLFSTLCAAIVAVVVNFIHPVTISLGRVDAASGCTAPESMSEIIMNLLTSVIANPVDALAKANYTGILFWAVIPGIALKHSGDTTKKTMEELANGVSEVVRWVIACAPFGILGLDEDMYSVSISLGSTINMDGAAAVITTFALTAAYSVGASITFPMAILLSIVATFSACGTSGVAGGSLLLVPLGCSLFGISNDIAMQIVGVGFIISVIQDSMETALNSSGDVIFTATAEFMDWKKAGRKLPF